MRADQHGNVGTTKPQIHTLQAMATLHLMLEHSIDHVLQDENFRDKREGCVKMPSVILALEGFLARIEYCECPTRPNQSVSKWTK